MTRSDHIYMQHGRWSNSAGLRYVANARFVTGKHFRRRLGPIVEPLERRLLLNGGGAVNAESAASEQRPLLAIIDSTLPDQQLLLQSLPAAETLFFDPTTETASSVLQRAIAMAANSGEDFQAVLVFSHGADGEFELGGSLISQQALGATAALWEKLGSEIAPGGSIDLFACDLASGTAGEELLNQLHELTGAEVFGSTNLTGKDGDWILEAHSPGAAAGAPPVNTALLADYPTDLGLVTIQNAAAANPNPVSGTTTNLSVLAADTSGESNVTYTWAATISPLGSNPIFSVNGNNAAKNTTVTFDRAGAYTFTVTASDGLFFAVDAVVVTVQQTLTTVAVTPSSASLNLNQTQLFTATGTDQFGQTMLLGPLFTWSVDPGGVGSMSLSILGLYSAGNTPGTATIRASSGGVSGTAAVTVADVPPTILTPAAATPNPVAGTTTLLSVLATDLGGTGNLTYTWSATASPSGSNPIFSDNGTASANLSTVTFDEAGNYTFLVTISDGIDSTTSSVNVTVNQTLTSVQVAPSSVNLAPNATQLFTAVALDQFGNAMATQPGFTWSIDPLGVGQVDSTGLYTAPNAPGTATVRATTGLLTSGTASVTVGDNPPTILIPAMATPNPVTGTSTLLSVVALDLGGLGNLTYTWSTTSSPAGSNPTFSSNSSVLSDVTTVTFDEAGNYTFLVTISDGLDSTTSSVNVTVNQTLTSVQVAPSSVNLAPNATQLFTAVALDQFGNTMATQPGFTWSIDPLGVGQVDSTGLYTAPNATGNATVRATTGLLTSGTASVTVGDNPPTILIPAMATPNPVTGTSTLLSVVALDLGGLGNLTYTWSTTSSPAGSNPTFSTNGTDSANLSTVTFDEAGNYTFLVTISDGLDSTTSSVNVTVNQTLTSVQVTPSSVNLAPNGTQLFTAVALDQFGNTMATQPGFTWSIDPLGVGQINSTGLYTAPNSPGTATVRAITGLLTSGTASVVVNDTPPTILVAASATPNPVTGTSTVLSVLATDIGGTGNLTYTWSATNSPAGSNPTFGDNGTATSNVSTVTFDRAGNYTFTVTVFDGFQSTTSSVNVTVEQTLTSVSVSPPSVTLAPNGVQQFAATALDQFGNPMSTQPGFTWSIDLLGVGQVSPTGLYTAPNAIGTATVRATTNLIQSGTASVTVEDTPPTLVDAASATPNPVNGTTTVLRVLATDAGGTGHLTYTWSAISAPAGAAPRFSRNGTASSAITTVTFDDAGNYTFQVTISDGINSTTSSVNVAVNQTFSSVIVTPANVELNPNGTQQFIAMALDQFGHPMEAQPNFTWSIDPLGSGHVDSHGLYTAPNTAGAATVRATADVLHSGTTAVTVAAASSPTQGGTTSQPTSPSSPTAPSTPTTTTTTPAPPQITVTQVTAAASELPLPDDSPALQALPAESNPELHDSTSRTVDIAAQPLVIPVASSMGLESTSLAGTVGLTTGIVGQLLIPVSFLASMFSSLPAWKWVDPISILGTARKTSRRPSVNSDKRESKLKELLG